MSLVRTSPWGNLASQGGRTGGCCWGQLNPLFGFSFAKTMVSQLSNFKSLSYRLESGLSCPLMASCSCSNRTLSRVYDMEWICVASAQRFDSASTPICGRVVLLASIRIRGRVEKLCCRKRGTVAGKVGEARTFHTRSKDGSWKTASSLFWSWERAVYAGGKDTVLHWAADRMTVCCCDMYPSPRLSTVDYV